MTTTLNNWNRSAPAAHHAKGASEAKHAIVDTATVNGNTVTYRRVFAANGADAYEITMGSHSASYGSKRHADYAWNRITGR